MAEKKSLPGQGGLEVDVVTPTGPIACKRTDAVIAPGALGEFEVLPGHIPFLTELHPGVLTLGERQREIYAVGSGFLEVSATGAVRVLVERAVAGRDVDVAEVTTELGAAARALKEWKKGMDAEWRTLRARHDWAQAQLSARKMAAS